MREMGSGGVRTPSFAISGVSAAYVGFIACPNASAICNPRPSLPVFGTDNPPVARTTASASSGSPSWRSTIQRSAACRIPVTSVSVTMVTPLRRAWAEQRVAHVARALRFREELARFRFLDERQPQLALEERDLLVERPRAHDAAQQMRRRVGDEARLVEPRGKDVAASAAADQNFPAAVLRAFEQKCLCALGRRENRRHRAGGAGADYDDARHASSDWRNVRLKRPDNPSSGGAVPGVIRDTPW